MVVAKKCDPKNGMKCDAVKYDLEQVLGHHQMSTETRFDQVRLQNTESELGKERLAYLANQEQLNKKSEELRKITAQTAATTRLNELTALRGADGTTALTPDQDKEVATVTKQIGDANALMATRSQANREKDVADLKVANRKLLANISELEETKRRIEGQLLASNGDTKKDALSVYGSFNGRAAGTANGADLGVGKVFSTGIAAQNMSQGVAEAARTAAAAECLKEAAKLLGDNAAEELRQAALAKCS